MALDVLRGAAQGIAGRALKRVAGNIRSGLFPDARGGSDFSDLAGLNTFSGKFKTKNLTFPIDVEAGVETGNHGHYIIFTAREQKNVKLSMAEKRAIANEGSNAMKKAAAQLGDVPTENVSSSAQFEINRRDVAKAEQKKRDAQAIRELNKALDQASTTVTSIRPATTRIATNITMYMPPTVQVSYNTNYTDTEIGAAANIAAQAYQDFQSGGKTGEIVGKALKKLGPEMSEGMVRMALGAADMIPGLQGAQEVIDIQRGFIKAPQMELAFKGITKRQFQYSFVMMPKSEMEAEQVEAIVKMFKAHMLPSMTDKDLGVRRLDIPSTFDIQYMYDNAENPHLHKISTCVLETMSVSYGGDRYKAFEGGRPVVTNLSLSFKEMDLITREKIEEGF